MMINLFTNTTVPSLAPLMHMLPAAKPVFPEVIFPDCSVEFQCEKMISDHIGSSIPVDCSVASACQNWIAKNMADPFTGLPTCSLNGRVSVDPTIMGSKPFRMFVRKNEPEMSINKKRVNELVGQFKKVDYSAISDSEWPYLILAALAAEDISVWDAEFLLILHQLHLDFKDWGLEVLPLFDANGDLTDKAYDFVAGKLFMYGEGTTQFISEVKRQLPAYQQVFKKFKYQGGGTVSFVRALGPELFPEAEKIYYIINNNRYFGIEPALGKFSINDIIETETDLMSRLCYVPFPGVPGIGFPDKEFSNPSELSAHDRIHQQQLIERHSVEVLDGAMGILRDAREITDFSMSKETWGLGDFDFPHIEGSPSQEFNEMLELMKERGKSSSLWEWFVVLRVRSNKTPFLKIEGISYLHEKNKIAEVAEPVLKRFSIVEQINFLQEIAELNLTTAEEITKFLQNRSIK